MSDAPHMDRTGPESNPAQSTAPPFAAVPVADLEKAVQLLRWCHDEGHSIRTAQHLAERFQECMVLGRGGGCRVCLSPWPGLIPLYDNPRILIRCEQENCPHG